VDELTVATPKKTADKETITELEISDTGTGAP
jgi:hypothetical protein